MALLVMCASGLTACAPHTQTVGTHFREPALSAQTAIMTDAARLPLRVWMADQPRAIIVAVHGFNDYSRAFEEAGLWFVAKGITTYAYDQRGFGGAPAFGLWPGADAMVSDLITVVAMARAAHPDVPLYVLGSSMGGAVAISAEATGKLGVDGIILAAPAVWGWSSMNILYKSTLWISAHTLPQWTLTGEDVGRMPSDNIEMLRAQWLDPLVIKETRVDTIYGLVGLMDRAYLAIEDVRAPTLYLYGAKDEIVPRGPTKEVVERFANNVTYREYPDGWHMLLRDLQREIVWRDVLAWIEHQDHAND
jgi:alpha-beta hydrolase superfamily lysophospholipase